MTTPEAIYRVALEHIRDGSDAVCTECGWMGDSPREQYDSLSGGAGGGLVQRSCPVCGSVSLQDGADEIAAYALAQGEKAQA